MEFKPLHFIEESVEVIFQQGPLLEKSPHCPDAFRWRGEVYQVIELLSEWRDYRRSGNMARNMRDEHTERASRRGSWGVGKFFFRVRIQDGRVFDIYYDRAPEDVDRRKGSWHLFQELAAA